MKQFIIILLTAVFSFSCARSDASSQFATYDGSAGVNVDAQGNNDKWHCYVPVSAFIIFLTT